MRQPSKIIFESRLNRKDILNDCTMSIGGTDFRIQQQGKACKGNPFASHKYAGKLALRLIPILVFTKDIEAVEPYVGINRVF